MHRPGLLIASGRDADIFEYEDHLVLRRSRIGRSMEDEARIMEHARLRGFPVPAIYEISDDGTELVMERIEGTSMMKELEARPWAMHRHADVLAALHHQLHAIDAPDWLKAAPGVSGTQLLHLDLHPLNVMMSPSGPVVIDWSNASRGHENSDVALTWLLLVSGSIAAGRIKGAVMSAARTSFVGCFLRNFNNAEVRSHLAPVVHWKLADPHI